MMSKLLGGDKKSGWCEELYIAGMNLSAWGGNRKDGWCSGMLYFRRKTRRVDTVGDWYLPKLRHSGWVETEMMGDMEG